MIFQARTQKKILQYELAKKMKVTGQFLGRVEKGAVYLPVKYFPVVSKTLGIPIAKLVDWQTEKFKSDLQKEVSNDKS